MCIYIRSVIYLHKGSLAPGHNPESLATPEAVTISLAHKSAAGAGDGWVVPSISLKLPEMPVPRYYVLIHKKYRIFTEKNIKFCRN
jgi:hypothetical protein